MRAKQLAIFVLGTALAGCGSPVTTAKTELPAYDPSNVAGVNGTVFSLNVTSDTAATKLHRAPYAYGIDQDTTNFSAACQVDPSSTALSERDILCLLEVEELDLYFSDLKINYNVPNTMCTYLKVNPYHFWGLEPGRGPTTLHYSVSASGVYTDDTQTDGGTQGGQPYCRFDYSGSDGPNCCFGKYVISGSVTDSSGTTTTTSTAGDWGGKPGACLAGPAIKSQTLSAAGLPIPTIYFTGGTGLTSSYPVPKTLGLAVGSIPILSNLFAANFYNPGDHPLGTGPGTVPDPSIYPARPVGLRMPANVPYLPSDTYEFSCLDGAQDMKYRIRLMIREWNKAPITENCTPGTNCPDEGGVEDDPLQPINDRLDWLDLGAAYPSALTL